MWRVSGHVNVAAELGWFYHFCKARIHNPAPNLRMYLHTTSLAQLLWEEKKKKKKRPLSTGLITFFT